MPARCSPTTKSSPAKPWWRSWSRSKRRRGATSRAALWMSGGLPDACASSASRARTSAPTPGVPKGYMRADFEDAWRRYLPPSPGRSATSATSATIVNIQRADVANDKADVAPAADVVAPVAASRARNAGNINAVADVADVADLAAMGRATKPADDFPDIPDFLL